MRKKVLYLHGLNSKLHIDRRAVLEKCNFDIQAPTIDYEKEPHRLAEMIKYFDADCVIGSSAGGLIGYYLSGLKQVPALLFNPALPFRHHLPSVPTLTERKTILQVVVGAQDEVVSAEETITFLKIQKIAQHKLDIHYKEQLGHAIPINLFETEVKFFLNHIQKNALKIL